MDITKKTEVMEITTQTKVSDIAAEYPWLLDELVASEPSLKILKGPIGKMLIKNATVADVMKKTGWSEDELRAELNKYIAKHENDVK